MQFDRPLVTGKIIKRYKRFLADVELASGEIITAHTANTGSMQTCWEPGWPVLLSHHDSPERKLKYSLEMTNNGRTWIGINTSLPNKLAAEAIKAGLIPELQGYAALQHEVKIGQSRIDLLLRGHATKPDCYVEVKNVTLWSQGNCALFPDAVSERGQKHLRELIELRQQGYDTAMLYIVQREDVDHFAAAEQIDPEYARLLKNAAQVGVQILPYQCHLSPNAIVVSRLLPHICS